MVSTRGKKHIHSLFLSFLTFLLESKIAITKFRAETTLESPPFGYLPNKINPSASELSLVTGGKCKPFFFFL